MNISSIAIPPSLQTAATNPGSTSSGTFSDVIGAAINAVEAAQTSAKTATTNLLQGGQSDIHAVALESQRAELALEMFQQVRNKFVQAYQEVMKMPM